MTPEEHQKRHIELHKMLDELVADFITHTKGTPSRTSVMDLLEWSYEQTQVPTPDNKTRAGEG